MNNVKENKEKLVQTNTGSIVEASHVETYTPYGSDQEARSFFIGNRLTNAGLPPKNAARFYWQDEARWDKDGDPRGRLAVWDLKREVEAEDLRGEISRLEGLLEEAKLALHAIYAGPRPVKP